MANKIDGLPPRAPVMRTDRIRRGGPAGPAPATPGGEQVELTGAARLLQQAHGLLGGTPEVDRERVEGVKRAIADGSYSVNAQRIAEQVLRLEGYLLSGA